RGPVSRPFNRFRQTTTPCARSSGTRNGLEPWVYRKQVLTELSTRPAGADLLPDPGARPRPVFLRRVSARPSSRTVPGAGGTSHSARRRTYLSPARRRVRGPVRACLAVKPPPDFGRCLFSVCCRVSQCQSVREKSRERRMVTPTVGGCQRQVRRLPS